MKFDFVVIGAGSAGCVIANRLSASGKFSVALLEAGTKDGNFWIHIPVGYFKTMGNPKIDWCYVTQPDAGINGRSIPWPRGRVLGGSSSLNGLLYVRGQADDFDHWRDLGNIGWGWRDILPYFICAETWKGQPQSPLRGTDGPLSVSPTRLKRDIVQHWLDAAVTAGYKFNPDYNAAKQEGVGYFQLTINKGRRSSSATAYLKPARNRRNLKIFTNMHVARLSFSQGKVDSIHALKKGKPIEISARKEVILSAGAIGSPQILLLSGVGAANELKEIGIEVKHHLPGVGKNLQDHLQARPIFKTTLPTINIEINNYFKQAIIAIQYLLCGTGPMTMAASLATGFLKTDPNLKNPDIQFHIQPFSANNAIETTHSFSAFTTSVLQMRPESRGYLKLKSTNIHDQPNIHPNYLATFHDQDTLLKGLQIARKIANCPPLKQYITSEFQPGAAIATRDSDALLQWVRETAVTIYHPTGTCKMGVDKMAVVNPCLQVYGVNNLRIADCSIMPQITSGNTNAPAIMIGEKAAAMILKDVT